MRRQLQHYRQEIKGPGVVVGVGTEGKIWAWEILGRKHLLDLLTARPWAAGPKVGWWVTTQFQARLTRDDGAFLGKGDRSSSGFSSEMGIVQAQSFREYCGDRTVQWLGCGGDNRKPYVTKYEYRSAERDLNKLCRWWRHQCLHLHMVL